MKLRKHIKLLPFVLLMGFGSVAWGSLEKGKVNNDEPVVVQAKIYVTESEQGASQWTPKIIICNNSSYNIPLDKLQLSLVYQGNLDSVWGSPYMGWGVTKTGDNSFLLENSVVPSEKVLAPDPECKAPLTISFSHNNGPLPTGFVLKALNGHPKTMGTLKVSLPTESSAYTEPQITVSGQGVNYHKQLAWGSTWEIDNLPAGTGTSYTITSTNVDDHVANYLHAAPVTVKDLQDKATVTETIQYEKMPTGTIATTVVAGPQSAVTVDFAQEDNSGTVYSRPVSNGGTVILPVGKYSVGSSYGRYALSVTPTPLVVAQDKTVDAKFTFTLQKIIGAYFENWARWRPKTGSYYPANIDTSKINVLYYAFAFFGFKTVPYGGPKLTGDFTLQPIEEHDINPYYKDGKEQPSFYAQIKAIKAAHPNLKTLISVGGWSFNDPGDSNIGKYTYKLFSEMVATEQSRQAFIQSAISYAHKYAFDGVDLDWEYPGDTARGGTAADFQNYLTFLQEFRAAVNSDKQEPKLLITLATAAVPKGGLSADAYFKWLGECSKYIDWINIMSYDYHGAFDAATGMNAPLHRGKTDPSPDFNVQATLAGYAKYVPQDKLVLGLATYGHTFAGVSGLSATDNGPGKKFAEAGAAGPETGTPGFLAYYEIENLLTNGYTSVVDAITATPYAYVLGGNNEWISYDDPASLTKKIDFLKTNYPDYGGVMVWSIDNDDFLHGYPLLTAIDAAVK